MKNHSELIKSKSERTLTAKGYKFLWRVISLIAEMKGLSVYSVEMKESKEKCSNIIKHLIIDKGMSIQDIKDLISSRVELK